jgi:hypothetical protein
MPSPFEPWQPLQLFWYSGSNFDRLGLLLFGSKRHAILFIQP